MHVSLSLFFFPQRQERPKPEVGITESVGETQDKCGEKTVRKQQAIASRRIRKGYRG